MRRASVITVAFALGCIAPDDAALPDFGTDEAVLLVFDTGENDGAVLARAGDPLPIAVPADTKKIYAISYPTFAESTFVEEPVPRFIEITTTGRSIPLGKVYRSEKIPRSSTDWGMPIPTDAEDLAELRAFRTPADCREDDRDVFPLKGGEPTDCVPPTDPEGITLLLAPPIEWTPKPFEPCPDGWNPLDGTCEPPDRVGPCLDVEINLPFQDCAEIRPCPAAEAYPPDTSIEPTAYVLAGASGAQSGTESEPYATLQAAIDSGALEILVGAGQYVAPGDIPLPDGVSLVGLCPAMTELSGKVVVEANRTARLEGWSVRSNRRALEIRGAVTVVDSVLEGTGFVPTIDITAGGAATLRRVVVRAQNDNQRTGISVGENAFLTVDGLELDVLSTDAVGAMILESGTTATLTDLSIRSGKSVLRSSATLTLDTFDFLSEVEANVVDLNAGVATVSNGRIALMGGSAIRTGSELNATQIVLVGRAANSTAISARPGAAIDADRVLARDIKLLDASDRVDVALDIVDVTSSEAESIHVDGANTVVTINDLKLVGPSPVSVAGVDRTATLVIEGFSITPSGASALSLGEATVELSVGRIESGDDTLLTDDTNLTLSNVTMVGDVVAAGDDTIVMADNSAIEGHLRVNGANVTLRHSRVAAPDRIAVDAEFGSLMMQNVEVRGVDGISINGTTVDFQGVRVVPSNEFGIRLISPGTAVVDEIEVRGGRVGLSVEGITEMTVGAGHFVGQTANAVLVDTKLTVDDVTVIGTSGPDGIAFQKGTSSVAGLMVTGRLRIYDFRCGVNETLFTGLVPDSVGVINVPEPTCAQ